MSWKAGKAVRWDWLLHSPVKFQIDEATSTLTTRNKKSRYTSVARLFSEQKCTISQTDKFAAEPNTKAGVRGEDFTAPWSLTASYAPSKTNRILTIIKWEADGNRIVDIKHADSNSFQCGDWKIEAELNTKRPASLYIRNSKTQATFSYGKEKPVINGQVYESKDRNSSILYDSFDGKWEVQEMKDRPAQATGKDKIVYLLYNIIKSNLLINPKYYEEQKKHT